MDDLQVGKISNQQLIDYVERTYKIQDVQKLNLQNKRIDKLEDSFLQRC